MYTGGVTAVPEFAEIVGLRGRTGAILDVMVAADIPDDINKIVEFRNLLSPQRLTDVVDVGANPIDDEPPYTPMLAAGLCHVTGFEPQHEAPDIAPLQALGVLGRLSSIGLALTPLRRKALRG